MVEQAFSWQDIVTSASAVSPIVLLTGILVLARLRPRPASQVPRRARSRADGIRQLHHLGRQRDRMPGMGRHRGLQYAIALVIVAYLLFFVSAGLCLLTAVMANVSLARARRWDQLPLVGVLGVLPLAYSVVQQERWAVGAVMLLAAIASSPALTATLSLLPILIYGLFFYALLQELDRPINWTGPSV